MIDKRTNEPVEVVPYGQSVIPDNRLEFLGKKCEKVLRRVPGNVLEIGVFRGGTIIRLAKSLQAASPSNKVYGIDTFSGHPYTDGHKVHPKGKYADVDVMLLLEAFKEEKVDTDISLFSGQVEYLFKSLDLENISFVHVDCDLYVPIKFCCEVIAPLINKGGMIYFDDYGHEHCPGATKAVNESFSLERIHEVSLPDGTSWSAFINL